MASDRIAQQRAADAADDQTGGPIGMAAIATPVAALIFTRLIMVAACLGLRGRDDHGGRNRDGGSAEREALARRRAFDRRLSALVREAMREGDVRADLDPRLVTRLLFGMVNSVTEWYRPGGAHGRQEVEDALVAVAFAGLRVAGPSPAG